MVQRVLIGAPVRQSPAILAEFLRSLSELETLGLALGFFFVDDNTTDESSELLRQFRGTHPDTAIERASSNDRYVCDDVKHHWSDDLTVKVAGFKDRIIRTALERDVDFLFLIDSDLVIAPNLLLHLVSLQKPVVSEVYWTSWQPKGMMLPQVWLQDEYTLYPTRRGEALSGDESATRTLAFLKMLRRPGTYRVGGLGGCTLMARESLAKGLAFAEVDNLSLWGEDRHFCVRARALGVELWADTRYPPLHIYRNEDLSRVPMYRARFSANYLGNPRLTLSMIVRNEADRWLRDALRAHRSFIHDAVIVDDASTDDTVDVVLRELDGIPVRLVRNSVSRFANEVTLRRQQWEESLSIYPDWLLVLDADEILEPAASTVIPKFIRQTDYAVVGLHLYDFWSETHYREDDVWCAHKAPRPFLLRYTPDFTYQWNEAAQHCGRMPSNIFELNTAAVDLRVKHMGWADPNDRARKYARYQALDPNARYGVLAQYESILDPEPNVVPWIEQA